MRARIVWLTVFRRPDVRWLETSKIAPITAAAPESWLIWLQPMPLMFPRLLRELSWPIGAVIELSASCRLKQRASPVKMVVTGASIGQVRLDQINSLLHRSVTVEKAAGSRRRCYQAGKSRSILVE